MNLYLDDDTIDRRLIAMLGSAGHGVITPSDANFSGAPDAQHFIYANEQSLTILTRNHDDFRDLHKVVQTTGGKHDGLVYYWMTDERICLAVLDKDVLVGREGISR